MNLLAVDTSGNHLTVLILKGEKIFSSHLGDAMLKHSITLMPEIENLVSEAELSLSDIDVFCAVVGPGSFTGIRIGVSTVKALAYANGKKVLAVTSFETLAYNKPNGKVLAVIDAKHGHYYACGFENSKVVLNPSYIDSETVQKLSNEFFVIFDDKADKLNGLINAVLNNQDRITDDREALIPLYVKKSQAEEERK